MMPSSRKKNYIARLGEKRRSFLPNFPRSFDLKNDDMDAQPTIRVNKWLNEMGIIGSL